MEASSPANISTKSGPAMERKGTRASVAIARANKVFPVPGGPCRRAPCGVQGGRHAVKAVVRVCITSKRQWTLFQSGSKVSTNWSNTWKHACYCAFMYTCTEMHACFHVNSLFTAHVWPHWKRVHCKHLDNKHLHHILLWLFSHVCTYTTSTRLPCLNWIMY